MVQARHTFLAAALYTALVATLVLGTPGPGRSQGPGLGQPNGPDVRVVNKPSEPVPVTLKGTGSITGDVNVVNSPTVKLASGSKVGIDPNSDGVTVRNTSSQPVPIAGTVSNADEPARSPYQDGFGFELANGITTERALSPLPADKRLVIEYFSATATVPSGQTGFFFIKTRAGGVTALHTVPAVASFQDSAFPGSDLLVAAQSIRLYADAGTSPTVSFRRSSGAGAASYSAFVSGYFVTP